MDARVAVEDNDEMMVVRGGGPMDSARDLYAANKDTRANYSFLFWMSTIAAFVTLGGGVWLAVEAIIVARAADAAQSQSDAQAVAKAGGTSVSVSVQEGGAGSPLATVANSARNMYSLMCVFMFVVFGLFLAVAMANGKRMGGKAAPQ